MPPSRYIAVNRKARFNYELSDALIGGLVLTGAEVKSAKLGRVNLGDAYAKIVRGELWLINAHIAPYQAKNQPHYSPTRPRKILLAKKELSSLFGKLKEKKMTLIPTKLLTQKGFIKIELALGRSKKKRDKRETIKRREEEQEIRRKLKRIPL